MGNENDDGFDPESTELDTPENNKQNLAAVAGEDEGEDQGAAGEGQAGDGEGGDDDAASRRIPYDRFKKVNDERRAFAEQNAALLAERERLLGVIEGVQHAGGGAQKREAPPAPFDFDAANEQLADATIDGDKAKVRELTRKIRDAERAELEAKYAAREEQIIARAAAVSENGNLRRAAEDLKRQYPFLDNKSDEADPEAIQEVIDLRDLYIKRGEPAAEALRKATLRIAKAYGKEPAGDGKPGDVATVDKGAATEAKKAAVARNAVTVGKQPPAPNGGKNNGGAEGKVDPLKTDKDAWAKLPDKEREAILFT